MKKDVVILTKSSKYGAYCVAGIERDTGRWIRLCSDDEAIHGALSDWHMRCTDGTVCQTMDVVRLDVARESPLSYQPENCLIDPACPWQRLGQFDMQQVLGVHPAEFPRQIYGSTEPFVLEPDMPRIGHSLTLVLVEHLRIRQSVGESGKPRTRANFLYNGEWYDNLSVTDPDFYAAPDGTKYRAAYLVVSLPAIPFLVDRYYKFIAKIIPC